MLRIDMHIHGRIRDGPWFLWLVRYLSEAVRLHEGVVCGGVWRCVDVCGVSADFFSIFFLFFCYGTGAAALPRADQVSQLAPHWSSIGKKGIS